MTVPHPQPLSGASYSAVELGVDNDRVVMLDQRALPERESYVELRTPREVARAITEMVVRGAPAIGISAAYGLVLAARGGHREVVEAGVALVAARPTAVNLAWAVTKMVRASAAIEDLMAGERVERLAEAARELHREDVRANRVLGQLGAARIPDGATILTHCNAGALATGGYGTALGVVRAAHEAGKRIKVVADETRPYLQGARLTAWELWRDGVDVTVITDGAAAASFAAGAIDLAVVGADRIAANGDVANKIGTYGVACLCHLHQRPFYVAAPWSTVDEGCASGAAIPIERRDGRELSHFGATRLVVDGARVDNPSFDVTPAGYITAIFTERGVIEPVGSAALAAASALL